MNDITLLLLYIGMCQLNYWMGYSAGKDSIKKDKRI